LFTSYIKDRHTFGNWSDFNANLTGTGDLPICIWVCIWDAGIRSSCARQNSLDWIGLAAVLRLREDNCS